MALQHLQLVARVHRPNAAGLVAARSDDLVALRVEGDLRDFVLVTLQQGNASACEHIVDASHTISRSSG